MDETPVQATRGQRGTGVRVVGLGASAGGPEPLQQFLSGVPASSGFAYVAVQHMDPTHKAMIAASARWRANSASE
jgi:chemotaxis response regulator CheB